jgi:hypothetical protein
MSSNNHIYSDTFNVPTVTVWNRRLKNSFGGINNL